MAVRLLDRVREAIRTRHYSRRTETAYVDWIRRYIVFHHKRHPSTMGVTEIGAFLSWLAVHRRVSASTQNQALSALLFLYREVLQLEVDAVDQVPRARLPARLPIVLSRQEVGQILGQADGTMWIIMVLLYGAGLRLQECLELRVKDVDFDRRQIVVRRGKGQKDRLTMLPTVVTERLRAPISARSRRCTIGTSPEAMVELSCRSLWIGSIPTHRRNGNGNSCFPPRESAGSSSGVRHRVSICTSRSYNEPWPLPGWNSGQKLGARRQKTQCGGLPSKGRCSRRAARAVEAESKQSRTPLAAERQDVRQHEENSVWRQVADERI
jgi:integrase